MTANRRGARAFSSTQLYIHARLNSQKHGVSFADAALAAALRRIQQILGERNDCATAAAELAKAARAPSPHRTRAESFLRLRAQAKTAEFRRAWLDSFDAPGQERWWTLYLSRHAR